MDILSAINDYISYANILADSPKEFIPKSISDRARSIGETAYRSTMGRVHSSGNESMPSVLAAFAV